MTKKGRLLRHIEIKGNMILSDVDTANFTITNNWGFGYRMTANVSRNGRSLFVTHGHIRNCFDVLKAMGTKKWT